MVQPPDKPLPPQPLPGPMPLDPKQPGPKVGNPVGKNEGLGSATGDPAADFLKALESGEVGRRTALAHA